MTENEIKEWYAKGGEVFIESSEEIEWLMGQVEKLTDICFDLGMELAELKGLPGPHHGT